MSATIFQDLNDALEILSAHVSGLREGIEDVRTKIWDLEFSDFKNPVSKGQRSCKGFLYRKAMNQHHLCQTLSTLQLPLLALLQTI